MRKRFYHFVRAQGQGGSELPLLWYFWAVGGALLVLLFAADAVLPHPSANATNVSGAGLPVIRIHSEHKGPEAVVLDTNQPTIVPAVTAKADAAVVPATAAPPDSGVRESFAQMVLPQREQAGASQLKKVEIRPQPKRKVSRTRASHPSMLAARRLHFDPSEASW